MKTKNLPFWRLVTTCVFAVACGQESATFQSGPAPRKPAENAKSENDETKDALSKDQMAQTSDDSIAADKKKGEPAGRGKVHQEKEKKSPKILVEDGGSLSLEGVKAVRVGINFEDLISGDADFNDAVLCFEGAFKIDRRKVVSYKEQTVVGSVFNNSSCDHYIDIKVVEPDNSVSFRKRVVSKDQDVLEIPFGMLSRLEVTMTPITSVCSPKIVREMTDEKYAVVAPDVCNSSAVQ